MNLSHDLVKQLKDAGFSLICSLNTESSKLYVLADFGREYYATGERNANGAEIYVLAPTLEELIEACNVFRDFSLGRNFRSVRGDYGKTDNWWCAKGQLPPDANDLGKKMDFEALASTPPRPSPSSGSRSMRNN